MNQDADHHFPATGFFALKVDATTLGKACTLASLQSGGCVNNDDIEDKCICLLDAALDAAIAAEIDVSPDIKLTVVPVQPQRRRRAGGKRGAK